MKGKIASALLCSVLLVSHLYAGDEAYVAPEYKEIKEYNFDLKIETDGGKVELEWNKFESDEKLKWWKFVMSKSDSTPSYPENESRYLGDSTGLTQSTQWINAGDYYVRLCAITHEMGRYCSEVQKLSVTGYEKKEYVKKDYEKKDEYKKDYKEKKEYTHKKEEYKKDYSEKKKTYVKNSHLSADMKERIAQVVEKFVEKLEARGYSDEKMSETLDSVIDRLEGLKSQAKYKSIATYMIELLKKERNRYDDSISDLESILDEF